MKFIKTPPMAKSTKPQITMADGGHLYPILTAAELLVHPRRRFLVEKIKHNTYLDDANYTLLYQPLIDHLIEFVQLLPYHPGGIPGSLMDYSLERGELALRLYHQQMQDDPNPLEAYALFSAALLQDVGKVMSQQKVMICDEAGIVKAEWLVCQGSLIDKGEYYKVRILEDELVGLSQAVTPILARQIMPPLGFTWIWDNHFIFRIWLAMLTGEGTSIGGLLMDILRLVYKMLESEHLKNNLPPPDVEITNPEETSLGEAFLAWLKEQLQTGNIINDPASPAHILPGGDLFIEPVLFRNFSESYSKRVDWVVVAKQFNYLGLTKLSGSDVKFAQYYAKYPESIAREQGGKGVSTHFMAQQTKGGAGFASSGLQKVRQGLVIEKKDLGLLFGKQQIPNVSPVNLQPVAPPISVKEASLERLADLQSEPARPAPTYDPRNF